MAILCSYKNSSWTETNGFRLVETASYMFNSTTSQLTSNSFQGSQTFSPGAVEVDGFGFLLQFQSFSAITPTSRVFFQLFNVTTSTVEREIDVAILSAFPSGLSGSGTTECVVFFPFSPFTFTAGQNYNVRIRTNVANILQFRRNATGSNWCRFFRRTSTATIGANDTVYFHGEITGDTTFNHFTFEMDNNSSTQYACIAISHRATMNWITGDTELRLNDSIGEVATSGLSLYVLSGGEVNIGSSSSPIVGEAKIFLNNSVEGRSRIRVAQNAIFRAYGKNKKSKTRLISPTSIGATSIEVDDVNYDISDFEVGDRIFIGGTNRASYSTEERIITGISGNVFSFSGGLASPRIADGELTAYVGNFTRNIKIYGPNQANSQSFNFTVPSELILNSVEFDFMGSRQSSAIDGSITTGDGVFVVENCSFAGCQANTGGSTTTIIWIRNSNMPLDAILIKDCLFNVPTSGHVLRTNPMTVNIQETGSGKFEGCWILGKSGGAAIALVQNDTLNFISCIIQDGNNNFRFGELNSNLSLSGDFVDNILITCLNPVFHIQGQNITGKKFENNRFYLGRIRGVHFANCVNSTPRNTKVIGCDIALGLSFTAGGVGYANNNNLTIVDFEADGYPSNLMTNSVQINTTNQATDPGGFQTVKVLNSSFGENHPATGADMVVSLDDNSCSHDVVFSDCNFYSSTFIQNTSFQSNVSKVSFQRLNGVNNDHRTYSRYYSWFSDSTIKFKGNTSSRIEPNNATFLLQTYPKQKAAINGKAGKIKVHIRKSATYNGVNPQLWLRANPAIGIDNDTLLATATGAVEQWEALEANLPVPNDNGIYEFFFKFNGTAGFFNIDTWK